jgi:GNAT superfamily N-acetyltransferase
MDIRRALPAEADSLAALWLRCRAASVPSIPPAVHTGEEVRRWFKEIILPSSEVRVADREGDVKALMVLDHEWIEQLYVDPVSTGSGIGDALLEYATSLRPTGLKLWTFQSNLGARRFYEAHGFVATVSTMGENEGQAPDVCYEWQPAPPSNPGD